MKFNLNGNLPLDPLDPRKENNDFLKPEDNQKIVIDPFGGKQPPKNKKLRKKKENKKENKKAEKTEAIEIIEKKIDLDKSLSKQEAPEKRKMKLKKKN